MPGMHGEQKTQTMSNSRLPLVFIVGNSRSGTTLLARILRQSPHIFTFQELHFFERMWTPRDEIGPLSQTRLTMELATLAETQAQGDVRSPSETSLRFAKELSATFESSDTGHASILSHFMTGYVARHKPGAIPCDQTPRNVFYLADILELWPDSRIINIVRDVRDVMISQKRKWRRNRWVENPVPCREVLRSWANYHPITTSRLWRSSIEAADRFAEDPRVLTVSFELLGKTPDRTLSRLCSFLDIPYDDAMLKVPFAGSSLEPDCPDRLGINAARASAWKREGGLKRGERYWAQRMAHLAMQRHGYVLEDLSLPPSALVYLLTWIPKLGLSLCLNRSRIKNMVAAAARRFAT